MTKSQQPQESETCRICGLGGHQGFCFEQPQDTKPPAKDGGNDNPLRSNKPDFNDTVVASQESSLEGEMNRVFGLYARINLDTAKKEPKAIVARESAKAVEAALERLKAKLLDDGFAIAGKLSEVIDAEIAAVRGGK